MLLAACLALLYIGAAMADITGTNPARNACLQVDGNNVNVRDSPCGKILTQFDNGRHVRYIGGTDTCEIEGVNYQFFNVRYGGGSWIAGKYLRYGSGC
jgi:hypothetical protein